MKRKNLSFLIITVFVMVFVTVFCVVNISPLRAATVEINKKTAILFAGEKINLEITGSNSEINWVSNNESVATVSSNGEVTAKKNGTAIITGKYQLNKQTYSAKCSVFVKEIPVFFNSKIMAHALGGLENTHIYSNALEGLEESIKNGYKFIEVDLVLTSDEKLVCLHGWDEKTFKNIGVVYDSETPIMTYNQFMETKIQGKYTAIDLTTIVDYMKKYEDICFEFDLKKLDGDMAVKATEEIITVFEGDKKLLDRLLIQINSVEMYKIMDNIYNFKYYQYFTYKDDFEDIDKVIKWMQSEKIDSVAINVKNLTDEVIKKFKDAKILILVHTVDDVELAKELLDKGIDIICTNFITYDDLN